MSDGDGEHLETDPNKYHSLPLQTEPSFSAISHTAVTTASRFICLSFQAYALKAVLLVVSSPATYAKDMFAEWCPILSLIWRIKSA